MSPRFDLGFDGTAGVLQHIQPGLHRLVAPNPSKFTFRGTGTYIVGEPGSTVVIDPGPDNADHFAALAAALHNRTVTHIAVTHTHRDHSPLAKKLAQHTGATVVGCAPHPTLTERDQSDIIDFGIADDDEIASSAGISPPAGDEPSTDEHADGGVDVDYAPDVELRDGDTISGDGWTLVAVHTPGHTSNHLCFEWTEANGLFTGDHVMGWSTSVIGPPDGNMTDYLASLHKLLERSDTTYWPTHGNPIVEPQTFVRALIAHRREREQQVLDALTQGGTDIEALVRRLYQHVSPKLWPAASKSVHAHLLGLIDQGRVASASGTHRLTDQYSPIISS